MVFVVVVVRCDKSSLDSNQCKIHCSNRNPRFYRRRSTIAPNNNEPAIVYDHIDILRRDVSAIQTPHSLARMGNHVGSRNNKRSSRCPR